jgi:hypothetical protein
VQLWLVLRISARTPVIFGTFRTLIQDGTSPLKTNYLSRLSRIPRCFYSLAVNQAEGLPMNGILNETGEIILDEDGVPDPAGDV